MADKMEKNLFEDFFKENYLNKKGFQETINRAITTMEDLEINVGVVLSLVSSGAGRYAGKELMELFGEDTKNINIDNEFYYEDVENFLNKLNADLSDFLSNEKFDIPEGYNLVIDFNENDGAIDMFIYNNDDIYAWE